MTLSIGTVGTGYVLERRGHAWFCTLLRNNFQKARPFLHFYFLSNENSFLVFTDHKGKQSVWFTCLEFRPRSNLFFYLSKTAQTPACCCRFQASTFLGSIFLFCIKFKNARTLLGWSSQSWLQWPHLGTSGQGLESVCELRPPTLGL